MPMLKMKTYAVTINFPLKIIQQHFLQNFTEVKEPFASFTAPVKITVQCHGVQIFLLQSNPRQ